MTSWRRQTAKRASTVSMVAATMATYWTSSLCIYHPIPQSYQSSSVGVVVNTTGVCGFSAFLLTITRSNAGT